MTGGIAVGSFRDHRRVDGARSRARGGRHQDAAVDDHLNRAVPVGESGALGLYVGYYQSQRQGEALHSPLFCLPGAGWQPVDDRETSARRRNRSPAVKELVVERGVDRLLVLYWYQTLSA